MIDDADALRDLILQRRNEERASSLFRRLVQRAQLLSGEELEDLLERAMERGQLSKDEMLEIIQADLVIRGRRRENDVEVYVVAEGSSEVKTPDVERAVRRAALSARTAILTIPGVTGKTVVAEAALLARKSRVWQLADGYAIPPEGGFRSVPSP